MITAPFLLRRRIAPYPPLPRHWARAWPEPGTVVEDVWFLLIALAVAGLVVGIAGRA